MSASITAERLRQVRDVAERLNLSSPGERWLRGLVMELVTVLLGDDVRTHPDLETSGALFPAPAPKVWNPVQLQSQGQAPTVAPISPQPGRALTIQEASAQVLARDSGRGAVTKVAAPPLPPALAIVEDPSPDPSVPDPGAGFLERLNAQLADEDQSDQSDNHKPGA